MATTNPFTVINQANADAAYEKHLPTAMAIAPEARLGVNLDVPTAIITGMGVSEKLPAFYEGFKTVPHLPLDRIEQFPEYVLALWSAQSRYTFATTPPPELPELLSQATKWRDLLTSEAKTLIARGKLNSDLLKQLTGTHGYKNVAFDLSGLATMFKASWVSIEGTTGLKSSELEEADKVALALATSLAHREHAPELIADATEKRQCLFTLFYTTYDQIRRAVTYLRWNEDDTDEFVPSLYSGRPNTNIVRKNAEEAEEPSAVPVATTSQTSDAKPTLVTNRVAVGYPNSDPLSPA